MRRQEFTVQEDVELNHFLSEITFGFLGTVADEYALIPSYFSDPALACPATSYFKSVMVSGTVEIVDDLAEKGRIFTLFMKKLQPEGGYDPIEPVDPRYASRLKGVAVMKIMSQHLTAKFKFGQNLSNSARDKVVNGLERRGHDRDQETIEQMKKYCPHKQ